MRRAAIIFLLSGLLGSGCAAIHTTEVQPGAHIDILAGVGMGMAPWIAELDFAYGIKFNKDMGLLLKLDLPLAYPPYSLEYTSAELYVQLLGDPIGMGIGLVGGYLSGGYVQFGKGFTVSKVRLGVDLGFGTLFMVTNPAGVGFGPFALLSLQADFFRFGLFTQIGFVVSDEDEMYEGSGVHGPMVQGGILIGFSFGGGSEPSTKSTQATSIGTPIVPAEPQCIREVREPCLEACRKDAVADTYSLGTTGRQRLQRCEAQCPSCKEDFEPDPRSTPEGGV